MTTISKFWIPIHLTCTVLSVCLFFVFLIFHCFSCFYIFMYFWNFLYHSLKWIRDNDSKFDQVTLESTQLRDHCHVWDEMQGENRWQQWQCDQLKSISSISKTGASPCPPDSVPVAPFCIENNASFHLFLTCKL